MAQPFDEAPQPCAQPAFPHRPGAGPQKRSPDIQRVPLSRLRKIDRLLPNRRRDLRWAATVGLWCGCSPGRKRVGTDFRTRQDCWPSLRSKACAGPQSWARHLCRRRTRLWPAHLYSKRSSWLQQSVLAQLAQPAIRLCPPFVSVRTPFAAW